MRRIIRKFMKYVAVFRIQISNHIVYVTDFLLRTVFLILILFIFTQLWKTTFSVTGEQEIAGFTLVTMMWYLVITEAIMTAMPRVVDKVETEVKNGDIVYFLQRPLSYVGYHYSSFMAEAGFRVLLNLVVGGTLIFALYGGMNWNFFSVFSTLLLIIGAFTLHFMITMLISLCSFWIEEARGYELVYTRIVMVLGGMLVPLDIFPEWLEQIARLLPFQHIVYTPASVLVGQQPQPLLAVFIEQWTWICLFGALVSAAFYMGVKKLNVNGG